MPKKTGLARFNTLIRLQQAAVDELRKSMATLENAQAEQQAMIDRLAAALEREAKLARVQLAKGDVWQGEYLPSYTAGVKEKQQEHRKAIFVLEEQLRELRETLRERFAELKKMEILQEKARLEEIREEKRREDMELDEIAAVAYQRKE